MIKALLLLLTVSVSPDQVIVGSMLCGGEHLCIVSAWQYQGHTLLLTARHCLYGTEPDVTLPGIMQAFCSVTIKGQKTSAIFTASLTSDIALAYAGAISPATLPVWEQASSPSTTVVFVTTIEHLTTEASGRLVYTGVYQNFVLKRYPRFAWFVSPVGWSGSSGTPVLVNGKIYGVVSVAAPALHLTGVQPYAFR